MSYDRFKQRIEEGSGAFGALPFWSWNDKLEDEQLVRQIHRMKELHMRGFFMHARGGLETEYLSDEWFHAVDVCVREAEKLGMEAWAYDENGWPSGFGGGRLLSDPDNFAVYLVHEITDTCPTADDTTVGMYALVDNYPRLCDGAVDGASSYLHIRMKEDASYVDTMRADITDKFLASTHAEYEARLGASFGGAMPGFFTDEPQYYRWRTPYSRHLPRHFLERYGYDIREALPALFIEYEGACEHRYDYHALTNELFTNGFAKRLYDWAEEHGVGITGHYIEERTLAGQMLCCGDIMPQYLYQHIPGIDYLGRPLVSDLGAKQLGSVVAQTGRRFALTETFACCGWDITPKELKQIAELQYSGGVNRMCHHLYPYSIRGQRKRDYPAFYSEHSTWQDELSDFNLYFNHLGFLLAEGTEGADTLVLHPIRSAWLHYRRIEPEASVAYLDRSLTELLDRLGSHGLSYHLGNERMMADMARVEGGVMHVGLCAYRTVILPEMETISAPTLALLKTFIAEGGRVYTYRGSLPTRIDGRTAEVGLPTGLPDVADDATLDALLADEDVRVDVPARGPRDVRTVVRRTDVGRLVYLTNLTDRDVPEVRVRLKGCAGVSAMDILTLERTALPYTVADDGTLTVPLYLHGSEAIVLTECDPLPAAPDRTPTRYITTDAPFTARVTGENALTLDRATLTTRDGVTEERPIEQIRDELLRARYEGPITLTFTVPIAEVPRTAAIVSEPPITHLTVNGHTLPVGTDSFLDASFRRTDVAAYLRTGENTVAVTIDYKQSPLVYEVLYGEGSETLRNCLCFDTEIECLYLLGDFSVLTDPTLFEVMNTVNRDDPTKTLPIVRRYDAPRAPFLLAAPKAHVNAYDVVSDGYPFYAGPVEATATYTYRAGAPTVLRVTGRFITCQVTVNGRDAGLLLFASELDLAPFLVEGANTITLTLKNSYRNLLGPHHLVEGEVDYVSPTSFSFEKHWVDGVCPEFDPRYCFIRYGLD